MISTIDKNINCNNNLIITYPKTVKIIFGNFNNPDIIHNLLIEIRNNIDKTMDSLTNVKGGMTKWNHFIENKYFHNFFNYLINKHQTDSPEIFERFYEKFIIHNAWGNQIKKEDSLKQHIHPCIHGILYLTKGCDLELPDLNLKITPNAGDYYILPLDIKHGFESSKNEENRYSVIFNIMPKSKGLL